MKYFKIVNGRGTVGKQERKKAVIPAFVKYRTPALSYAQCLGPEIIISRNPPARAEGGFRLTTHNGRGVGV